MKANRSPSRATPQAERTLSREVPRCESVCINMYKNCGGWCNKKHGHMSPHRCGYCRYTWELSNIERAARLSQREQS